MIGAIVIPFWTSFVVRTYAWLELLGAHGVITQALVHMHLVADGKLKEALIRVVFAEYPKRLGLCSSVAVTEIDEARLGSDPSAWSTLICR